MAKYLSKVTLKIVLIQMWGYCYLGGMGCGSRILKYSEGFPRPFPIILSQPYKPNSSELRPSDVVLLGSSNAREP